MRVRDEMTAEDPGHATGAAERTRHAEGHSGRVAVRPRVLVFYDYT